jgi:hypothetical protein
MPSPVLRTAVSGGWRSPVLPDVSLSPADAAIALCGKLTIVAQPTSIRRPAQTGRGRAAS